MRLPKYRSVRTNGFSSKLENAVHDILKLRERAGEISEIKCQQQVVLQDGSKDVRITWRVDFSYVDNKTRQTVFVEAKGIETNDYKLKLKMWKFNPPAPLEIYKGTHARPILVERIGL